MHGVSVIAREDCGVNENSGVDGDYSDNFHSGVCGSSNSTDFVDSSIVEVVVLVVVEVNGN